MHAADFMRLVEAVGTLSARQMEDLQNVLTRFGLRIEALRQAESRVAAPEKCGKCAGSKLVRWGRGRTGFQRWRCTGCGTTRSTTSGTIIAGLHRPDLLHALIKEMFPGEKSTCRKAAERLGVDKMTIWRWRRTILRLLSGFGSEELSGIVEADEAFQRESRKGSREWVRHAADPASYPEPPRLRWADYAAQGIPMERGLSKWQIPILTAADRSGKRRAEVIPNLRAATVIRALAPFVMGDAVLCSDKADRYKKLAKSRGMEHKVLSNKPGQRVIERVFHIQNINALHSRYEDFIKPFRGPATKYLSGYIAWFLMNLRDSRADAPDAAWDRLLGLKSDHQRALQT